VDDHVALIPVYLVSTIVVLKVDDLKGKRSLLSKIPTAAVFRQEVKKWFLQVKLLGRTLLSSSSDWFGKCLFHLAILAQSHHIGYTGSFLKSIIHTTLKEKQAATWLSSLFVPCHFKIVPLPFKLINNLSFSFDGMHQQPSRQKDKSFDFVSQGHHDDGEKEVDW
jgi:hypothetical protein